MPKTANNKPIIAVDIDDVLKESSQAIVEYSNEKWGTNLTIEDYTENWGEAWGVDADEYARRAREIHSSKVLVIGQPFNETRRVLKRLSQDYRLVITTSREMVISTDTQEWIEQNFEGIFTDIHFAGIWDGKRSGAAIAAKATKASLLKKIGANYLIDDQVKHCFAAANEGIVSLLFGNYAWNRHVEVPDHVFRVEDWKAVEEFFDARAGR